MSHPPSLGTHPGFNKLTFLLLAHHEDLGASEQGGMREADLALYLGQVAWEHLKEPDIALAWMLPELLLRLSILRNVF